MVRSYSPRTRRWKQVDLCECEARLGYRVSSRTGAATQRINNKQTKTKQTLNNLQRTPQRHGAFLFSFSVCLFVCLTIIGCHQTWWQTPVIPEPRAKAGEPSVLGQPGILQKKFKNKPIKQQTNKMNFENVSLPTYSAED